MIAYVDSSVILRLVLGQKGHLREWRKLERAIASALVEVECLRTLDRLRLVEGIASERIVATREAVYRLLELFELVEPTRVILDRAAQPTPTVLGTLDAIHLSTALAWAEHNETKLAMATHDDALALAARSSGLRVIGA